MFYQINAALVRPLYFTTKKKVHYYV